MLTNQPIYDGGTLRLGKGPDAPELLVADLTAFQRCPLHQPVERKSANE